MNITKTVSKNQPEMVNGVIMLSALLKDLGQSDRQFAQNLISWHQQRGMLSEKQFFHVNALIDKAQNKNKNEREKVQIGEFGGMLELFNKAKEHLVNPSIVLDVEEGIGEIRLTMAKDNHKVPGSINVATPGGFGNSTWFGRILQDGNFEKTGFATPVLIQKLQEFANDPAKMAAEYGKLTGNCCFCSRKLTDERSTNVGYGPRCAEVWDLPWGE